MELADELRAKYKSNSYNTRPKVQPSGEPEPELKQIASGPVRIRKKSPGRKFLESFIAEDVKDIKDYILYDVLLPAIKNTVIDAVTNSIQMIFWGETGRASSRQPGRGYVSYGAYSSPINRQRAREPVNRSRFDFDDIILSDKGEAEEILSNLIDLTIDYGFASVANFYYMAGVPSTPTDQKWGWTNLSAAYPMRVSGGYLLKLPKPEPRN